LTGQSSAFFLNFPFCCHHIFKIPMRYCRGGGISD